MRLLPVLLALSLTFPAFARRRAVSPSAPLPTAAIESIAVEGLTRAPGVIVGVRRGNTYYLNAWGEADEDAKIPMRAGATMQIASVSKQFTAAAVVRLASEGKLSFDDPLRKFVPELDARFDPITIRHLLNHTSGIYDYLKDLESIFAPKSEQEILEVMMKRELQFPPGSQWQYTNSGYYLLGIIIQRVTNQTYDQYLRDAFLEPMKLAGTNECRAEPVLPVGHLNDGRGGFNETQPIDQSLMFAVGGLCSTASDLLRWNLGLSSSKSYAFMTSETVEAYVFTRYGFGLIVDTFAGTRRIWHNGLVPGFQSHLAHYPDHDVTVVVLLNSSNVLRDRASELGEKVARALLVP